MKRMAKIVLTGLVLLLASCSILHNYGYPYSISFGQEGGTKEISGKDCPYLLEIKNADGERVSVGFLDDEFAASDSFWVSHHWLTVKAKKGDDKVLITAEPNTTGHSRKLYVLGMIMDSFFDTTVKQN